MEIFETGEWSIKRHFSSLQEADEYIKKTNSDEIFQILYRESPHHPLHVYYTGTYVIAKDKKLFLRDLSARIPYNVECEVKWDEIGSMHQERLYLKELSFLGSGLFYSQDGTVSISSNNFKPYLRSLSSMTDEEKAELSKKYLIRVDERDVSIRYHCEGYWDDDTECSLRNYVELIDWLNEHHFDYRGLIEKDLAIEIK